MPYNPKTYNLTQHPDVLQILEKALKEPVFIPTEDKGQAQSWAFKLGRYRKAHEAQAVEWPNADNYTVNKYSWLNFNVKFLDTANMWGLEIREVDEIPMPGLLNADTLQPLEDDTNG